jgi:ATP-dependent Lhr-like helicase
VTLVHPGRVEVAVAAEERPELGAALQWFASRSWTPFDFQLRTWRAYLDGRSGLVHAPTGLGKSLAVWFGPLLEWIAAKPGRAPGGAGRAEPLRVLWLTPLRALSADTAASLAEPVRDLGLPWTIECRTGDTAQSIKRRQRQQLPTCLITTPESLSLILSYAESRALLSTLRCVVVDEWHELLSTKRGTQTELALARLRQWNSDLRTWGLSATLGNLEQALGTLVPRQSRSGDGAGEPVLIHSTFRKPIEVVTLIPSDIERFPWAGHLGLRLLPGVLEAVEAARSSLVFTNTRSQAEYWFRAILQARPEWLGRIAIHHGSLDRGLRTRVEGLLKGGGAKCVVCTSSLDVGVDFAPVELVVQIGSPRGVARLMQRAGRSGHQPGAVSRILCVPAHVLELVEFAAARDAIAARRVESREPMTRALDVLAQHLVTVGAGGGFTEPELLAEVRDSSAFGHLSEEEWQWTMDFVRRGGPALVAYPQYARIAALGEGGRWSVSSARLATQHRLAIGTISSDVSMLVRYTSGRTLGNIEESFISRLREGDRFVFAGRTVELVRVRAMTAYVRRTAAKGGIVPIWGGGRMSLSSELAAAVRARLEEARRGRYEGPEMLAARPLLELQRAWSRLPAPDELLVERVHTRDGHHVLVFPFEGRLVHEGLSALCAYRISRLRPTTVQATATDYGFDLHSPEPLDLDEAAIRRVLSPERLLDDLMACLNATQMARRRFRDVARVAGLLQSGYPGSRKPSRHLQASSDLFFDVFEQFDPGNLLLTQAKREVLEEQLEVRRLRATLERIARMRLVLVEPMEGRLTPLAFPVWAELLRANRVSSESWTKQVSRMAARMAEEADRPGRKRRKNQEVARAAS